MSFDPRSLERLRELGRQLPQKLPDPAGNADTTTTPKTGPKRHRVETEQDPDALFRELMTVSEDGTVPEHLIALMEEGVAVGSIPFAQRLETLGNQRLAFVIGGADGLTPALKQGAQWQLSLSPMTFPHELARLMLIEQLFRAQAILQGSPYHRA